MASDSAPTVIDDRTAGINSLAGALADHVIEESIVQPESIAETRSIFTDSPLLPVKPPEIHALTLERTDHGIEIRVSPCLVVNPERHRGFGTVRIDITLRSVIFGSA